MGVCSSLNFKMRISELLKMNKKIGIIIAVFLIGNVLGLGVTQDAKINVIGLTNPFQTAILEVISDLSLDVKPNPLDYGILKPGSESVVNVTLTPGTSHISVSVDITGSSLIKNIKYDKDGIYSKYDGENFILTATVPKTISTKLSVPSSQPAGSYGGSIVYTVLEV